MLRSKFFQAALVLVITFAVFRYGIRPPAPWSVVTLYMAIVLLALLVYISSDSDSWKAFVSPIRSTLVDDSKRPVRVILMVLLPLLLVIAAGDPLAFYGALLARLKQWMSMQKALHAE